MILTLHSSFAPTLTFEASFDAFMQLRGEIYRKQPGRETQLIYLNATPYFIKQYQGVGFKEIIKNLTRFTLPVIGASNEWQALNALQAAGVRVPTPLAFGKKGLNPASQLSFVVMEALNDTVSLETVCQNWREVKPAFLFKQALIQEVATITKTMHDLGINHRDCYICHFLLATSSSPKAPELYLIDLHRAVKRRKVPLRWLVKDLAGLYFSSKDIGLTQKDLYRFLKTYYAKPLRHIFQEEKICLQQILKRGEKLYRDHQ